MAHATNTLAQLRKADREDTDEAIHSQHATILEELAEQILEARMELNDPYVVVLADVERALRDAAAAAARDGVDNDRDLRDAMWTHSGSVPGEGES
jgi:FKBP-type peptidyl-prolyl cis-trans isomerase (trigger factor)